MGNILSKCCCFCCLKIRKELRRDRAVEIIYKEITNDPMGYHEDTVI